MGYQVWTYALLEGDFSFCKYRTPEVLKDYPELETIIHPPVGSIERCQIKYPPGYALLRLPLMGPVSWATHSKRSGPFDLTKAEHSMSVLLGSLFLLVIFALLTQLLIQGGWPKGRSAFFVSLGLLGTGTFHYGTYDGSFSHIGSALLVAAMLSLLNLKKGEGTSGHYALRLGLGFLGGLLLVLVRNTAVIILAWLALSQIKKKSKASRLNLITLAALTGGIAAAAIEVAYNFLSSGVLSISSYGTERFLFDRPKALSVLFDLEHGLFTQQPIFAIILVSAIGLKSTRKEGLSVLAIVLAFAVLFGFWHSWTLGAGFGHRGFIDLAPMVILLGGRVLHAMESESKRWTLAVTWLGLLACTAFTTLKMWAYWQGQ